MAAFSVGLSAKLVLRFGIQSPLVVGLLMSAVGLALLARALLRAQSPARTQADGHAVAVDAAELEYQPTA